MGHSRSSFIVNAFGVERKTVDSGAVSSFTLKLMLSAQAVLLFWRGFAAFYGEAHEVERKPVMSLPGNRLWFYIFGSTQRIWNGPLWSCWIGKPWFWALVLGFACACP